MTNKQLIVLALALSAASLTGCSDSGNEPTPAENTVSAPAASPTENFSSSPPVVETTSPPFEVETPAAINSAEEVPAEEPPPLDEQVLDDAVATGMTARATREEPANAVEEVEKN